MFPWALLAQPSVSPTEPATVEIGPLSGTLFFTAAQRERLDAARRRGTMISQVLDNTRPPMINGFVHRHGGDIVVWVDGESRRLPGNLRKRLASSLVGEPPRVKFRTAPK